MTVPNLSTSKSELPKPTPKEMIPTFPILEKPFPNSNDASPNSQLLSSNQNQKPSSDSLKNTPKNVSIENLSTSTDIRSNQTISSSSNSNSNSGLISPSQKEAFLNKCCDKKNSKAIQTWLDTTTEEQTDFAFNMISEDLLPLSKHVFGNYVIQKFIEKGTNFIRGKILQFFKGKVHLLSINPYACRVIQAFLQTTNKDNNAIGQNFIVSELKDFVLEMIYDHSGNHVIQKLVTVCTCKVLQPIVEQINLNVDKLAFHSFGSRVIQKVLDRHFENPEKVEVGLIVEFCLEKIMTLSKCQNGNYIIQHLLERGSDFQKVSILNALKDHFLELSMDKFASNVTQKSLLLPCPSYQTLIIDSLITNKAEDKFKFGILFEIKLVNPLSL